MKDLKLSENALTVLKKRYLAKDEHGHPVETPQEMFMRVARNIALMDLLFMPGLFHVEKMPDQDNINLPVDSGQRPRDKSAEFPNSPENAKEPSDQAVASFLKKKGVTSEDILTLQMAHTRLHDEGHIEIGFDDLLNLYPKHQKEIKIWTERLYDMMASTDFMFNSPALMNAGRHLQQLSACFVLPVDDDLGMIFESLKHAALIHQSGGGTGFSFSRLRPKNDIVHSTGGVASGPVSFMKVFNAATEAVKQGGTRRGANMGILRVDHPDILEFITCKENNTEVTNFNISVAITDEFMNALQEDREYNLINPRNREVAGKLSAKEVFDLICNNAWRNGDPGVVFIDRINQDNPTPGVGCIESTNPCGEQPLLPYEACTLGSINLGNFVTEDEPAKVNYDRLGKVVKDAIHALDNALEANKYPIPEIEKMVRANRKVGLGLMGWADMLLRMKIRYDSEEALSLAREVASFINRTAQEASAALAKTRGTFPNWRESVFDTPKGLRRRNATVTTIAPTGTISILAGASTGIEPLFSIAFTRHVLDGAELVEVNPVFEETARSRGFYSEELMRKIARQGNLDGLDEVPDDVKHIFVTAHDIAPEYHVKMQAAFQEYTENAVSKTINMPHDATVENVESAYRLAYELGCKGITVYRDGSRETQVLTAGTGEALDKGIHGESDPKNLTGLTGLCEETSAVRKHASSQGAKAVTKETVDLAINGGWGKIKPIPRPRRLHGMTDAKETPLGKLFLTLNALNEHPIELFAQIGKAGSDVSAFTEAIARLISLALRSGIAPKEVANQLSGIGGARSVGFGPHRVRSVPDAIGQFLYEFIKESSEKSCEKPAGAGDSAKRTGTPAPADHVLDHESEPSFSKKSNEGNSKDAKGSEDAGVVQANNPDTIGKCYGSKPGETCENEGYENEVSKSSTARSETETAVTHDEQDNGQTSASGELLEELFGQGLDERGSLPAEVDLTVRPGSLFNLCPSCGIYAFAYVEGCSKCFACGYSEC
jgi:ribonucleoside-diphosphate reductase alpha chain